MASKVFNLTIARVDGPLFEGEALSVNVPGAMGDMTILPHHAALVSPLSKGTITVTTSEDTKAFEVVGGTLEVSNNEVIILL